MKKLSKFKIILGVNLTIKYFYIYSLYSIKKNLFNKKTNKYLKKNLENKIKNLIDNFKNDKLFIDLINYYHNKFYISNYNDNSLNSIFFTLNNNTFKIYLYLIKEGNLLNNNYDLIFEHLLLIKTDIQEINNSKYDLYFELLPKINKKIFKNNYIKLLFNFMNEICFINDDNVIIVFNKIVSFIKDKYKKNLLNEDIFNKFLTNEKKDFKIINNNTINNFFIQDYIGNSYYFNKIEEKIFLFNILYKFSSFDLFQYKNISNNFNNLKSAWEKKIINEKIGINNSNKLLSKIQKI